MKKLKLQDQARLQLNKKYISPLSQQETEAIAGGFTYSLSWGDRCKQSKAYGEQNPYDCGKVMSLKENCKLTPSPGEAEVPDYAPE